MVHNYNKFSGARFNYLPPRAFINHSNKNNMSKAEAILEKVSKLLGWAVTVSITLLIIVNVLR